MSVKGQPGKFWRAVDVGGHLLADASAAGPWETFKGLSAGGGGADARSGRVTQNNRAVQDDGGPFLALGATFFPLPWCFKFDRDRLRRNMTYLRDRGVHYIRSLGAVGGATWEDRESNPHWPDYDRVIADATDWVFDEFGMRTMWTIFGGTNFTPTRDSRRQLVDRFVAMASGREQKIMHFEGCNEFWQNGFGGDEGLRELKDLCTRLKDSGLLVALGAAEDSRVAHSYIGWEPMATVHYDRANPPWRPVRQPWGYPGEYLEKEHLNGPMPKLSSNNEPIGPQSSVAEENRALPLIMAFVTTFVAQNSAYVFHAGPGIRSGGAADLARGRSANFDELPPFAGEALQAMSKLRSVLPADMSNWTKINAQWANAPWDSLVDDIGDDELLRGFSTERGSDFYTILLDMDQGRVEAKPKRDVEICYVNPFTADVGAPIRLSAGENHRFEGSEAAIIKGRYL